MSPVIEYVDPENAGWTEGFWAFTRHIWWPPAPGPTWFLGVLLAFSAVYAVVRTIWPVLPAGLLLRARQLLIPIALCSCSMHLPISVPDAVAAGRCCSLASDGTRSRTHL